MTATAVLYLVALAFAGPITYAATAAIVAARSRRRRAAVPNPLLSFAAPFPPSRFRSLAHAPAESYPTMTILQEIEGKFSAPGEHLLGKLIASAYAAHKAEVVAALLAQGTTAATILKADAHLLVAQAFARLAQGQVFAPILIPRIDELADAEITTLITLAGGEMPVVEAFADKLVAEVVAYLEAS